MSYLETFFSTGDLTKDMLTLKNTILNAKIAQVDMTKTAAGKETLFLMMGECRQRERGETAE